MKRATFGWKWLVALAICVGVAFAWNRFPTTCSGFLERLLAIPFTQLVLFAGTVIVFRLLWRLQDRPDIDFVDLIKGEDRKVSWSKMAGIGAFCVASWFVIDSRIVGYITWELIALLLIYAAVYTANPIAFAIINLWKGRAPDPPAPPITTTTAASVTTTTQGGNS